MPYPPLTFETLDAVVGDLDARSTALEKAPPPAADPALASRVDALDGDLAELKAGVATVASGQSSAASAVSGVDARLAAREAYGHPLDSFEGATDTARFAAALAYQGAQTYKAPIRFPARAIALKGPFVPPPGMAIVGPQVEREYAATSDFWGNESSCVVSCTSAKDYFFGLQGGGGKATVYNGSWLIDGVQFRGNASLDWLQPCTTYPGPVLSLATFRNFGLVGFRRPIWATVQACDFSNFHIQQSADIALNLSGADSNIGAIGGHQFIDHCGPGLPAVRIGMDSSVVAALFITPTAAGCAVQVYRGSGTQFIGNNLDSAAQKGVSDMCRGSLVQLRGGTSSWTGNRFFGCMSSPSTADGGAAQNRGYITATGGRHVITGAQFENGASRRSSDFTPAGTPHLYVAAGATVTVAGLAASDPLILRQQVAGGIVTDLAPSVSTG